MFWKKENDGECDKNTLMRETEKKRDPIVDHIVCVRQKEKRQKPKREERHFCVYRS